MKTVAILHYAAPPTIGGVEQTIYYHALELARAGCAVRVLAGAGQSFDPRVEMRIVPELGSRHPDVLSVKQQLDQGQVTSDFVALRDKLAALLSDELAGVDTLIAHNILTLHKNLALTAALYKFKQSDRLTILAWHHDLAWEDLHYRDEMHDGYPWNLLRTPWPGVRHVTVSNAQQTRLAALYNLPPECITVVPPGVDPARFFRWTDTTRQLVNTLALLESDLILLLPARMTRRKNIEMALRILAALRHATAQDARLVVTGPPGPHNPANAAYTQSLLDLRRELGIENAAHFLYELGVTPDDDTMADLYQLADALLFPSASEGFGIPVLEAGLARLPAFCSEIQPFQETGQGDVSYFSLNATPTEAATLIQRSLQANPHAALRRRVLNTYTWEKIVKGKILPLL